MIEVNWSARAERDFIKQIAYLEKHSSKKAVLQYMGEVAQAVENISNNKITYQTVDERKRIHRYRVNKHTDVYYKEIDESKVVLVTIFDTRQNPGKLKL
jgi:plasmid stabilization system protein ParE